MTSVVSFNQIEAPDGYAVRKAQLLDAVATMLDGYVEHEGVMPDALVFVIGGIDQPVETGWATYGVSHDLSRATVMFAAEALRQDIVTR